MIKKNKLFFIFLNVALLLIIFLLINSELNLLDIPITSNVAFAILVFSLSIYSFVRKQFIMACLLLAWSYRLISLAYPIPRLSFWVAYLSAFILGIVLGNIFKPIVLILYT